ncbi:hypothetical protein L9F63_008792, partial [Diploptera punctata]
NMIPLSDNKINRRIKDIANCVENEILERPFFFYFSSIILVRSIQKHLFRCEIYDRVLCWCFVRKCEAFVSVYCLTLKLGGYLEVELFPHFNAFHKANNHTECFNTFRDFLVENYPSFDLQKISSRFETLLNHR